MLTLIILTLTVTRNPDPNPHPHPNPNPNPNPKGGAPALVVAEGEEGGKRRDARERRVLARDVCRRRAAEEEGLHLQPYVIGAATGCDRGCNRM